MAEMSWSLQDAKNKFSAVVDAASRGEPQVVTRRGVRTAVVISADDYDRLIASENVLRPSFRDHLLSMPRGGDDPTPMEAELRDLEA